MIDVIILNRNLGAVCDTLVNSVKEKLGSKSNVIVVDAGSTKEQESTFTTIKVDTPEAKREGLRFGRGMNVGIKYLADTQSSNEWVLLMPVDTELVTCDIDKLFSKISQLPDLVAVKPLEVSSAYRAHLGEGSLALGWNLEEGPWLLKWSFIEEQRQLSSSDTFFDNQNFRGFLTSLEIAFRAYANGKCVGITSSITTNENENYLIERAALIDTEPIDVNAKLLIEEGSVWLGSKYGINDPWAYAQLVRLLHDRFFDENPELNQWRLNYDHDQN